MQWMRIQNPGALDSSNFIQVSFLLVCSQVIAFRYLECEWVSKILIYVMVTGTLYSLVYIIHYEVRFGTGLSSIWKVDNSPKSHLQAFSIC